MSGLVLGIDGGGTKTLLALADAAGQVVLAVSDEGSNPVDQPRWRDTLRRLFAAAEPWREQIVGTVAGIGGFTERVSTDAAVRELFGELSPWPTLILNDVYLACDAAFLGQEGILVIAGTGSMAVGRNAQGETFRTGGWSDLFGDEGSGFWIGRRALSITSQVLDGRSPPSAFATAIAAACGPGEPIPAILNWLDGITHHRSAVASLSRVVAGLAENGDPTAREIIAQASVELGRHIVALRARPGLAASPWSLFGGLRAIPEIEAGMERRYGAMTPPALSPIGGALWRAAVSAGWATDPAFVSALEQSLRNTTFSSTGPR